jgi:hypothetical protein
VIRMQFIRCRSEDPVTDDRMALVELLRKSGDGNFPRAWRKRCCRS